MSAEQRVAAATSAIAAKAEGLKQAPQPECPFLATLRPGALCNKVGGVCSLRQYESDDGSARPVGGQPATLCPNRFLEHRGERSVFSEIAQELFKVSEGAKVIKEIPFLEKETLTGEERAAKAGRIDWIVVPRPARVSDEGDMPWIAVETQGVYFSGVQIWPDIAAYLSDPSKVHMPHGTRRPDYRSSGAKRLAPQLSAKAPVMNRWGRKIAIVIDVGFFNEMGVLAPASDFDNSELVWFVVRYDDNMSLVLETVLFSELAAGLTALQAAKPVNRAKFQSMLISEMARNSNKVYDA